MEERYLLAAARYIEMNSVRAGLVDRPGEYPWSSTAAHTLGRDDRLVKVSPLLELVDDWERFMGGQIAERDVSLLRRHERTGRPLGGESFIDGLERALSRRLRRQKPEPKADRRNR
jgi:putative transposase